MGDGRHNIITLLCNFIIMFIRLDLLILTFDSLTSKAYRCCIKQHSQCATRSLYAGFEHMLNTESIRISH